MATGKPGGKYYLKSKVSHRLVETAQILMDHLLQSPGDPINKILRFNEHPYMAGEALHFVFFGINFAWVTEHGPDKIEPWVGDTPVMNQELYDKYISKVRRLPSREILRDAFINGRFTHGLYGEVIDLEGAELDDYFMGLSGEDIEWFDDDDVYHGIEGEMRGYFDGSAMPIIELDVGEYILSSYDVEYGMNDHMFVFIRQLRRQPAAAYAYHEILQKVDWKDVDLPFHAWDMGFSEGPVDS